VRSTITKLCNGVDETLQGGDPDRDRLQVLLARLQSSRTQLSQLNDEVKTLLLDEDADEETLAEEVEGADVYEDAIELALVKINRALQPRSRPVSPTVSEFGTATSGGNSKKQYQLPKIQIKKFDGDILQWLGWWAQFSKIDGDEDLHAADKFQYLVQSLESKAKLLVERYPQSADNYPLAIESLQKRFGNPKILRKVYIRELQKLVISNVKKTVKLSEMYDKLDTHLRALDSLGACTDSSEFLFPMVESSLSEETLIAWQRSSYYEENGAAKTDDTDQSKPKSELDRLMRFLSLEVESEQQRNLAKTGYTEKADGPRAKPKLSREDKFRSQEAPTAASLFTSEVSCVFCRNKHQSHDCVKARNLPVTERIAKVREANCCYVCLRKGHRANQCKSLVQCFICKKKHHAIMCNAEVEKSTDPSKNSESKEKPSSSRSVDAEVVSSYSNSSSRTILLHTLKVRVIGRHSTSEVRLVLDSGSQRSYIKSSLAEQMGCPVVGTFTQQNALFGGFLTEPKLKKNFQVPVANSKTRYVKTLFLTGEKTVCASCPTIPYGSWIRELKKEGIQLSDFGSTNPEVDILIGQDLWGIIITGKTKKLSGGLVAMETVYGWTLGGPVPVKENNSIAASTISMFVNSEKSIPELWDLEAIGIRDSADQIPKEEHDKNVKKNLQNELTLDKDGRYKVKLPWVNKEFTVPTNKNIAEKRLVKATEKLKDQNAFAAYDQIFKDWETEGIIEQVDAAEDTGHFLPHHPVFKDSVTTPIRPVFDASCKVGRNPSINHCLEKGPNLLELIPAVLLRFREKQIGSVSDIRKAFQMISVDEDDRKFQKFLWWESADCFQLKAYQHKRVVFGMNCSPFVLAAVLEFHLDNVKMKDRRISSILKKSLYVDNSATSFDTHDEYVEFKERSTEILKAAKMEVRCWETNSEQDQKLTTNVLGLAWDKSEDSLYCKLPDHMWRSEKITKRNVLSAVSKVYDPIGFTCPALLQPKMMIQDSWCKNLSWDEEWQDEAVEKFRDWIKQVPLLESVKIPRCTNITEGSQLHIFVDASQSAYAAVVFNRVEIGGEVIVSILAAKSRLAPVKKAKPVSIPRLELLGCLIGSRLANSVSESLGLHSNKKFFWTDSSTALAWIQRQEDWGTFVGNRTKEISQLTDIKDWRHVPGEKNPADLPSRGCSPLELLQSKWWEGPEWLKLEAKFWPRSHQSEDETQIDMERRKTPVRVNAAVEVSMPKFSSYMRNVRVYAFIRRFIDNARKPKDVRYYKRHPSLHEIQSGEIQLIRQIQRSNFPKKPDLKNLIIQQDIDGLYHVKTRLDYGDDEEEFKSPFLLPSNDAIVHQLIQHIHVTNCHAGAQFVLNKLREKYWVLKGRKTVTRVIHKCVSCARYSAQKFQSVPAPLPQSRIERQYAFQTTGVDLAGPLILKGGVKTWLVIYTCAVYRGIYIDLVDSISTEEFLLSLERFTWICGRPSHIYSDNGTNFVGAVNLMNELDWKSLEDRIGEKMIRWRFNPPTAAWWGGWWERLVRTTKDLLRRMIGRAKLSRKELVQCVGAITHTINNRPLTTLTEDCNDLTPLTPAMFMKDLPVSGLPEFDAVGPVELRAAYKKIRDMKEALKARFRKEYIGQLVQRASEKRTRAIRIGDLVIVGSDNKKRFEWPLGRVIEVHPGRDGEVRVVKVKTAGGILLRPVQRLYPLEVLEVEAEKPVASKAIKDSEADEEQSYVTRTGRRVKKPIRYASWIHN